jgi:hypothetical protein
MEASASDTSQERQTEIEKCYPCRRSKLLPMCRNTRSGGEYDLRAPKAPTLALPRPPPPAGGRRMGRVTEN